MRQNLTTDCVERCIQASPEALYDVIADVKPNSGALPRDCVLRVDRWRHWTHGRRPDPGPQQGRTWTGLAQRAGGDRC